MKPAKVTAAPKTGFPLFKLNPKKGSILMENKNQAQSEFYENSQNYTDIGHTDNLDPNYSEEFIGCYEPELANDTLEYLEPVQSEETIIQQAMMGNVAIESFSANANARITELNFTAELNSMIVTWMPENAVGLEIQFDGGPIQFLGGNVQARSFTGLTPGTTYAFRIRARNAAGTWISWISRNFITRSLAPENTPATSTHNSVAVRILEPLARGAAGYEVEFNGSIHVAIRDRVLSGGVWRNLNSWTANMPNLEPCREYAYRVRSTNAAGAGPWTVFHRVRTRLTPPANLRTSNLGTTSLVLQWDASIRATSYDVTLDGETSSTSATSRTFTGLSPGTNHRFTVVARNQHGESNASTLTRRMLSEPPTNIASTPATNSVRFTWSRPEGATNFEIEIDRRVVRTGNVLSFTVSDLMPNTHYAFRMRSINASGEGPFSPSGSTRTMLETPTNLRMVSSTVDSVTIQWDAVQGASSFEVRFGGVSHIVNGTSKTFTGLAPDSRISVDVRAINAHTQSGVTRAVTVTTLPPEPQNITTTSATTSVSMTWDRVVNATGYDLVFNGNSINVTATTTSRRTHTVSGLAPNTVHTFSVRARNAAGNGAFSPVRNVSTLLANAPMNLQLVSVATDSATVRWNAVAGATNYNVSFNGAVHNTTETSITAEGLVPDTRYTVNVTARNAHTQSTASANLTITTLPPIPRNISATSTTSAVTVSWDRLANATGYDVIFNGAAPISFNQSASSRVSRNFTGLASDTRHTFSVRARNVSGSGEFSPVESINTLPLAPPTPTNIRSSVTHNSITLTWDPAPRATSYEVSLSGTRFTDNTSITVDGLGSNLNHTFRIRARNATGNSAWSPNTTVRTLVAPPQIPANVRVTNITQRQATLLLPTGLHYYI